MIPILSGMGGFTADGDGLRPEAEGGLKDPAGGPFSEILNTAQGLPDVLTSAVAGSDGENVVGGKALQSCGKCLPGALPAGAGADDASTIADVEAIASTLEPQSGDTTLTGQKMVLPDSVPEPGQVNSGVPTAPAVSAGMDPLVLSATSNIKPPGAPAVEPVIEETPQQVGEDADVAVVAQPIAELLPKSTIGSVSSGLQEAVRPRNQQPGSGVPASELGRVGLGTGLDRPGFSAVGNQPSLKTESIPAPMVPTGERAANMLQEHFIASPPGEQTGLPVSTKHADPGGFQVSSTPMPQLVGADPQSQGNMQSVTSLPGKSAPSTLNAPMGGANWNAEVAGRVSVMVNNGLSEASLQINPPELGRMDIKVVTEGEKTRVLFTVQGAEPREVIEQALPRLREMLVQSGLVLAGCDVTDNPHSERRDSPEFDSLSVRAEAEPSDVGGESIRTVMLTASNSLVDFYV